MNAWNPFVRLVSLDPHGEAVSYNFSPNPARQRRAEFFGVMEIDEALRRVRFRFGVWGFRCEEVYQIEKTMDRLWLAHRLNASGAIDWLLGWILGPRISAIIQAENVLVQRLMSGDGNRARLRSIDGGNAGREGRP